MAGSARRWRGVSGPRGAPCSAISAPTTSAVAPLRTVTAVATSTPWSNAWVRTGVATVLSRMNGSPWACAAADQASRSMTLSAGLPIVSPKTSRVLSSTYFARSSGFAGSTNLASMPNCDSVLAKSAKVPP